MSDTKFSPAQVIDKMLKDDLFSQWLGISLIEIKEGYSKIKMTVRPEMMNGLGIVHGGIAEAKEIHNGKSTGLYHITITNQNEHIVAMFKGTCYRTNKKLVEP